ncbi:signal peptidase I [Candidatus Sumerlaeota bacterium]|nr:signal peptidase I [Candidatus Sumerlaeota bacterium]
MKVCPHCHFYNQERNKRCLKCGWILDPVKDLPQFKTGLKSRRFPLLDETFRKILWRLKKIFRSEIPEGIPHRFPFLAAGLSLLFGAGQVYNRQYKKAAFFFLADVLWLWIVAATITLWYSNIIIFFFVAFLLYAYNDGLVTAVKINGQQWTLRYSLAAYSALFFILGFVMIISQFFFFSIFKLVHVTQPTLEPFFHDGDLVYVDCLTYKFRKPQRGEIIFYTPERFYMEIPSAGWDGTKYAVWERRTFERIMGLPGDVVERKQGKFYLNGNPMPYWMQPILPDNVFPDMKFEVPEKRYLAIFSHSPQEISLGPSWGGKSPSLRAPGVILIGWDKTCLVEKKQIFGRAMFIINPPKHRRALLYQ